MYNANLKRLPQCCGFYEAGSFEADETEYEEKTPGELVTQLVKYCEGRPLMFNFVADSPEKLVDCVRNWVGVLYLGHWINPGSGNRIDCYVIPNKMTTED